MKSQINSYSEILIKKKKVNSYKLQFHFQADFENSA